MTVKLTKEAAGDVKKLRDVRARAKIRKQLERFFSGNLGDVKPVGEGVSESRIHYGPGYRIYFFKYLGEIIIVACVGDKSTQSKDIERAKRIKEEYLKSGGTTMNKS